MTGVKMQMRGELESGKRNGCSGAVDLCALKVNSRSKEKYRSKEKVGHRWKIGPKCEKVGQW